MKVINRQGVRSMFNVCKVSLAVSTILSVCFANNAYAQCELEILFASDAGEHYDFGDSVAIDNDFMIIGDHGNSEKAHQVGAAYIFKQIDSTWEEIIKLTASDGEQSDEFGRAVDISGNLAIVGAYKNDGAGFNHGAAYIFRYIPETDEWVEQTKLLASDGQTNNGFGWSVAICDDVIVVGSTKHGHDGGPLYRGAVYIFRSTDDGQVWEQEAELRADDGATNDYFGHSVDIDEDNILIGAFGNDDDGSSSGSAYIFKYDPKAPDNWIQVQKLLPLDGNAGDHFGESVSISHELCVVGADGVDVNETNSGAAYVFRFDEDSLQWIEEATLLASDGQYYDNFGIVAIDGNVVVVGAPKHSLLSQNAGAVYIYEYQEDAEIWIEQGELEASDNDSYAEFGSSVAIENTLGIAGAPGHDGAARRAGAVYTFNTLADQDSNNNGIPDACEIGFADLNDDGVVGTSDLLILLGFWGPCPGEPVECLGDLNADQNVGTADLLILLNNWG